MGFPELVVMSLATWRISSLFVHDDGPFDAFKKLREAAGVEYYDDGLLVIKYYKGLAKLLTCVWCVSIWVGIFAVFAWAIAPALAVWLMLPFALSGAAVLVEEVVNG